MICSTRFTTGLALAFALSPIACLADADPLDFASRAHSPFELAEAERVLKSRIQAEVEPTRRSVMYRTSLAAILDRQSKTGEAIAMYEQALLLRERIGGPHLFIEGNIARLLERQHEFERAMDYRKRDVRLFREWDDCANEWGAILRVGHLFRELGQLDAALESYDIAESVLKPCKEMHSGGSAAMLLTSRAEVLRLQGHHREAQHLLTMAAELEAADPVGGAESE